MSSILNITTGASIQFGTNPIINIGSTSIPIPFTVNVLAASFIGSITASSTDQLYASGGLTTAFLIGVLLSDQDGMLELQAGSTASNSNIKILANVPFFFAGTGLAYNSGGGFAGAVTTFTSVKLKNTSVSTANIAAWFFN